MTSDPIRNWIGRELQVDGIRWRVVSISDPDPVSRRSTVQYERVYDKTRDVPPIPRDPERPLT